MKLNNLLSLESKRNRFALFFLIIAVVLTFIFGSEGTFAKFTEDVIGSDSATVAKPLLVVNCDSSIYIDEQGCYRFSVSNFDGNSKTQTPLLYEIRIVTYENTIAVPASLYVASSSDYSDKTVLLNEASLAENGVYYYQDLSMQLGLTETTVYYELVFLGLSPGATNFDIEIYAEQADN